MGVDLFGFAYAATVAAGGIMGYAKAGWCLINFVKIKYTFSRSYQKFKIY